MLERWCDGSGVRIQERYSINHDRIDSNAAVTGESLGRRPIWRRDATARTRPGEFVDDVLEVVFLAGRLGRDDDGWPLVPLIDRLRSRGIHARVVCLDRADPRQTIPASSSSPH